MLRLPIPKIQHAGIQRPHVGVNLGAYFDLTQPSTIDLTGRHIIGQRTGSLGFRPGPFGNLATTFTTGANASYVGIGTGAGTADLGPVTFIAWIYRNATGTGAIWDRSDGNATNRGIYINVNPATGNLTGVIEYASSNHRFSCSPPSTGVWHQIALTWDGIQNGTVQFYIDGLRTSTSLIASGSGARGSDAADVGYIGGTARATAGAALTNVSFDGAIANVEVWRRVLQAGEVYERFRNPLAIFRTPRRLWASVPAAGGGFFSRYYYDMPAGNRTAA